MDKWTGDVDNRRDSRAMLKRIGATARRELERFFRIKVYLDLAVQVRRNWRRDEKALKELGFLLTS